MNQKKAKSAETALSKYIYRIPAKETDFTVISNDLLNCNFGNDTAKLLLLYVLRQPNDYEFDIPKGEEALKHHNNAIRNALDCLEGLGFLHRIKVSGRKVKYYWYESPKINPDYIKPEKPKKEEGDEEPKRKTSTSKGKTLNSVLKKSIDLLYKAQLNLLNIKDEVDVLPIVDSIEQKVESLEEIINENNDEDPE